MEAGAKLLIKHISLNNKIFIQVDADCDGYTSASLLINYLNALFPYYTQTKIIYRTHDEKAHGLLLDTIPEDVKLVIAPDASSSDFEIHQALKEKGIDVLVIDHHEAEKISEYACIINNQLCNYPNKTLSGAGVVYKFCCYLDSLLNNNVADEFVDLATTGIIADVEPLQELETRAIILKGLQDFKNPLLKTMVDKDDFHFGGKDLTPFNVAWYIAPYINAVSRSGTEEERRIVFESMIDFLAYELVPSTKRGCKGLMETRVEQAVRICNNVKNRQTKIKEKSMETILEIIEKENLTQNKVIAVKLDPKYAADKNLTGLVANSILDKYCRPILILNQVIDENKEIKWVGSGRGYEKGGLGSFRDLLENSGLVDWAQGHAYAFGVSIPDKNFDKLINYINEKYKDFDCTPIYKVDLIWDGNKKVNGKSFEVIANEEKIWGRGVEDPLIAITNFKILGPNIRLVGVEKGKPTITISLEDGSSLVKFKATEEEYKNLFSSTGYVSINAIGTCSKSSRGFPQFTIIEYEVIDRNEYYF